MSENPDQSPQESTLAVGVRSGSRDDLCRVAKYQKVILVCILMYLVAFVGQFLLPPDLRPFLGIVILAVGLVSAIYVFKLAIKVYGTGLGILFGLLALIPLIGLIVLLVVNGKATGILKQNGIRVGLLGAKLSTV